MAMIQPKGEKVKQVIKWISERRNGDKSISTLIQEASTRFNLSPKEEEFLYIFYKEDSTQTS
ncbi:MAG: hypothetical protein A2Z39_00480 [Deltaproteobacteria bacterium RBG_19FT_COMBO_46_9]|nr:MAG: hypothetical protein A2Z39_00480 [Deltaproteobacteria bacterium RBG_19FT_COMBO_46_9]